MELSHRPGLPPVFGMAAVTAAAVAAPLAWLAYSRWLVNHPKPLAPALDAPRHTLATNDAGNLSYYIDDRDNRSRPLVLVHSINAAASAREMAPLFDHYRGTRNVIAMDLPGFGFSERTDRDYTPALYAHSILQILRTVAPAEGGADVVALSLGCELVARAAVEAPELFHSVTFLSPTGFSSQKTTHGPEKAGRENRTHLREKLLKFPVWSQAFYDLIVSHPSIDYYLSKSFTGSPDPTLREYAFHSSHHEGARHAPLSFLGGRLFTPNVREDVYARMNTPALVLFDRDGYVNFEELARFVESQAGWKRERIANTLGMPHFEQPDATCAALDEFWARVSARSGVTTLTNGHAHPS